MDKNPIRTALRTALCAAALATVLSACTQTEMTELECVRVADDHQAEPGEQNTETLVCDQRRVRLVYRDKYDEPDVIKDETW